MTQFEKSQNIELIWRGKLKSWDKQIFQKYWHAKIDIGRQGFSAFFIASIKAVVYAREKSI